MKIIFYAAHLIFLIASFHADPCRAATPIDWGLTTDIQYETVFWPQVYGEGTNATLNRLQMIPNLTAKNGEAWRLSVKPEFFWDPQNSSPEERVFLNPGEASVKYKTPTASVQVGSHILHWGVTDAYNPLDMINPRQYHDPLRSKKIGVTSLLFAHSSESAEQELIYIPKNQVSILPGTNSRWLPREIFIPRSPENNIILLLPENIHYSYGERSTLNKALEHNVGLRLQWHLSNMDLGLYGYEGLATFPIVQPEVTGTILQISPKTIIQTDPNIVLRLKDYRLRQGGFSWTSSQASFLMKYAASYSQSFGDDPLLPGWRHEQVVAVEKSFSLGSEGSLITVLQYSCIQDQKENDSNFSANDLFRRAWMAGGRYSWGDLWTVNALGLYDTLKFTHFQQYSVARRLQDLWTLELSATVLTGSADTPLGIYNRNDDFRLALSRSF